jgi:hypothetical protein
MDEPERGFNLSASKPRLAASIGNSVINFVENFVRKLYRKLATMPSDPTQIEILPYLIVIRPLRSYHSPPHAYGLTPDF